ncbi:Alpha-1,2-fucosyltransferase [Candidatus Planktophila sulfonica]|uniref:Alpha-1,2-fucosyltransferase n=1 Tax=Candidatus Planktophila sulfonica TaxID=1884904 RepID=A0A249KF22_9ACTN|nr:alpha-1,2-fucosyltransferase [Candidatus Planktophila sulfonica]ASY15377.1 Alpha-1,2-fucosyltransferase [Candidatus Planktophila sulfonica]
MKGHDSNKVVLNGGLGNQLFQIACGLYYSVDKKVLADGNKGLPNLNSENRVILESLDFPGKEIAFTERQEMPLQRQLFRILLVAGIKSTASRNLDFIVKHFTRLTRFLGLIGVSQVIVGRGVGYTPGIKGTHRSIAIGYFQTFRYASDHAVFKILKASRPKRVGVELQKNLKLAEQSLPIIVHIRLGDYLLEPNFGILPPSYFLEGISLLREKLPNNPIWVFSDDVGQAKKYFQGEALGEIIWIPNVDGDPVSTLELMKHGSGYVISNSTYSWWAAFLRSDPKAKVVAPSPWFKVGGTPDSLLPDSWVLLNPWPRN